jgi:TolB-like protein/class 3 adenylate cyclase/Flp pilus assembly protein TadD
MADEHVKRRLVAILAADVVGYSRLMERDESDTLAMLKARRKEVLEPLVARYQGRIFKFTGDGVLVEFTSAVNAVQCAIELQQGMAAANADLPDARQMVLRIGINLGDVMVEGSDLYGDGVNIAARLEGIAESGGVLISGTAFDHVKNKAKVSFEDLGMQNVKNIAEPVRVYRVTGMPRTAVPASSKAITDKPSIAVLPFLNMSSEAEHEYFADGITEDIITELCRFRSLCVIARNSSFAYKNRSLNARDIGRDLGVEYLLEGSVRRVGTQVRVTAQLVEAATGKHLWAERYDRRVEDIFSVQDEIMRTIVSNLPTHVEGAEHTRAQQRATESFSAYDHWLRGKHLLNKGKSQEGVLQARQHFEKAIKLDPNYAAAYVDLAESYHAEYNSPWTTSREAVVEKIFELARLAVELDPRDSRTHLVLAWGYLYAKADFDLAKIQVEQALALNPNDYYNFCFGGWLSACTGDLEHALACSNEALRRSPLVSDGCLETRVAAEYLAGNYGESIMAFGRMLRPDLSVYGWVAAAYAQLGRAEEARTMTDVFLKHVATLPWAPKGDSPDAWRQYWAQEFRAKDLAAHEHLFDGLRKAGLTV